MFFFPVLPGMKSSGLKYKILFLFCFPFSIFTSPHCIGHFAPSFSFKIHVTPISLVKKKKLVLKNLLAKMHLISHHLQLHVEFLPRFDRTLFVTWQQWPSGANMFLPFIAFSNQFLPQFTDLPHHRQRYVIQKGKYYQQHWNKKENSLKSFSFIVQIMDSTFQ